MVLVNNSRATANIFLSTAKWNTWCNYCVFDWSRIWHLTRKLCLSRYLREDQEKLVITLTAAWILIFFPPSFFQKPLTSHLRPMNSVIMIKVLVFPLQSPYQRRSPGCCLITFSSSCWCDECLLSTLLENRTKCLIQTHSNLSITPSGFLFQPFFFW